MYKRSRNNMSTSEKIIVIICAVVFAIMTYTIVTPYITNAYNNVKNYIQQKQEEVIEDTNNETNVHNYDNSNPGGIVPDVPPTYEIVFRGGTL